MEGNTVESLLELQEIDGLIGERRARLLALRAEADQLVSELEVLNKEAVALKGRLEGVESELRHAERTVQAGRATLKRLQARAQEVHNMREHAAARAEVDAARQNLEAAETALPEFVDVEEQKAPVRELINRMPDHLRLILTLGYFQQLPYAEIATVLEIPVGTVKSRLHAAVSHFARLWRSHTRTGSTTEP